MRVFACPSVYTGPVQSVHIVYASTSGNVEHVVDVIETALREFLPGIALTRVRADAATPEELLKGDVLLLASGSWNTGGIEGQLNPFMHALLKEKAAGIDLAGKQVAIVALGDERYRYTAKSGDHMEEFVTTHGGVTLGERLVILNEPYGQEDAVNDWTKKLSSLLA